MEDNTIPQSLPGVPGGFLPDGVFDATKVAIPALYPVKEDEGVTEVPTAKEAARQKRFAQQEEKAKLSAPRALRAPAPKGQGCPRVVVDLPAAGNRVVQRPEPVPMPAKAPRRKRPLRPFSVRSSVVITQASRMKMMRVVAWSCVVAAFLTSHLNLTLPSTTVREVLTPFLAYNESSVGCSEVYTAWSPHWVTEASFTTLRGYWCTPLFLLIALIAWRKREVVAFPQYSSSWRSLSEVELDGDERPHSHKYADILVDGELVMLEHVAIAPAGYLGAKGVVRRERAASLELIYDLHKQAVRVIHAAVILTMTPSRVPVGRTIDIEQRARIIRDLVAVAERAQTVNVRRDLAAQIFVTSAECAFDLAVAEALSNPDFY